MYSRDWESVIICNSEKQIKMCIQYYGEYSTCGCTVELNFESCEKPPAPQPTLTTNIYGEQVYVYPEDYNPFNYCQGIKNIKFFSYAGICNNCKN